MTCEHRRTARRVRHRPVEGRDDRICRDCGQPVPWPDREARGDRQTDEAGAELAAIEAWAVEAAAVLADLRVVLEDERRIRGDHRLS